PDTIRFSPCKLSGFPPQWNIAALEDGSRRVPHWYETPAESARFCTYPAVHCRFAGALGVAHANRSHPGCRVWGVRLFAGEHQALAGPGGVCAAPCRTTAWGGLAPGRSAGPATDVSVVWTADRAAGCARWRFLRDRFSTRGCAHWQSAI